MSDPKQNLADWFVEQMRKPRDAAAEARHDAFEADKADVLHAWMVSKGRKPRTARTRAEMEYAASVDPCPKCQTRGIRDARVSGSGQAWELAATCTGCGLARTFPYATEGDPTAAPHHPDELSSRASYLITKAELEAELERLLPRVSSDGAARQRALVTINELLKLADPGPPRDKLRTELIARLR